MPLASFTPAALKRRRRRHSTRSFPTPNTYVERQYCASPTTGPSRTGRTSCLTDIPVTTAPLPTSAHQLAPDSHVRSRPAAFFCGKAVSGSKSARGFQLDELAKLHAGKSSMRSLGWPAALASRVSLDAQPRLFERALILTETRCNAHPAKSRGCPTPVPGDPGPRIGSMGPSDGLYGYMELGGLPASGKESRLVSRRVA